jgi:hypothetical protein
MNHAVFDDSDVPDGGGTRLEDLMPEDGGAQRRADVPVTATEAPRPPRPGPSPAPASIPDPGADSRDELVKMSFLIFFLYCVVSSSLVSGKMAEIVPELFGDPKGVMAFLGRGTLMAGTFYMIRKYMTGAT